MDVDLAAAARRKTDEQLVAMLEQERQDYTAEALDAARAELLSRGVAWVEPTGDAEKPGPAAGPAWMSILGAVLILLVVADILWRGVSLPSLVLLIPGAALLARSMKTK